MESRKCHAQRPAKSISHETNKIYEHYQPRYTSKNPKTISSNKHTPGCSKTRRRSEEKRNFSAEISCDKFAFAKRLHAENLQHQPLPDRIDDFVFKNARIAHGSVIDCDGRLECHDETNVSTGEDCFEPVLGCKKPKTRMDLAICWEIPMNPIYEPRKSRHIDGTEGGSAPAVFALIQHTPMPRNRESSIIEENTHGCARKNSKYPCDCCFRYFCKGMEPVAVAESRKKSRSNSLPRIIQRKCALCEPKVEARYRDSRLIRSAVNVALGLEEKSNIRRNELSKNTTVPRPRTPFARRSFCIDTLTPPFSVTNGRRDADYPEHWRLMSVYQQSYKNPQKIRIHHP